MLKNRIISTLKFFDLQDYPQTLLELQRFLVAESSQLRENLNTEWELINGNLPQEKVDIDKVLHCLETECQQEVEMEKGFYCLLNRKEIIEKRWRNYLYGIKREKLIKRFTGGLRHLPFVRGVALGGSQAMGLNKENSDIDLLIITEDNFLWLARTWVTIYFQILGNRRHGKKIANRFCLNHYLAKPKAVERERNLYKAMEYGRLRTLVYPQVIEEFQQKNLNWINAFFPNWQITPQQKQAPSRLQKILEKLFTNRFGHWLERMLRSWQINRIKQGDFIFVTVDELSFHPESKHKTLLRGFFG